MRAPRRCRRIFDVSDCSTLETPRRSELSATPRTTQCRAARVARGSTPLSRGAAPWILGAALAVGFDGTPSPLRLRRAAAAASRSSRLAHVARRAGVAAPQHAKRCDSPRNSALDATRRPRRRSAPAGGRRDDEAGTRFRPPTSMAASRRLVPTASGVSSAPCARRARWRAAAVSVPTRAPPPGDGFAHRRCVVSASGDRLGWGRV